MANRNGPIIDMTPDGGFVTPARTTPSLGTVLARLLAVGVLLGAAFVAFWAALFIIPALILLGFAGYAVARLIGIRPASRIIVRRYP